jgi:glycosyltransferase involved in cell wall biosynthesis
MMFVGATEPGYDEYLKQEGLYYEAEWQGLLPAADVKKLLDQSHFFVYLTRWFGEGQSNALTEAMGRGCVPIVTDHGFNRATVAQDTLVVRDRTDSESIAAMIAEIWQKGSWHSLSRQMTGRVASNYTDEQAMRILRDLYNPVSVTGEKEQEPFPGRRIEQAAK